MNILVVGSGGREHALVYKFAQSPRAKKVYCAPGNAGIGSAAECVNIDADNIEDLAEFALSTDIDLTFVGGESPLALGIVDRFEELELKVVGASRSAARLEASKQFAKDFMKRHAIPTAKFHNSSSKAEALSILAGGEFGDESSPVVIKADGLAAGKGVIVASDRREAIAAVNELDAVSSSGSASKIVIEDCLFGREVSLLMFVDGGDFALMPPTRDHKRIGEGDTGPNTGGMGTITDSSLLSEGEIQAIISTMIVPTLRGCIDEGFRFRGILFLGLMITSDGPKLLEYNVRFGDPETQSILVRLETDLVDICEAMLNGKLGEIDINWRAGSSATVVLAAKGYPQSPQKGNVIRGIDAAQKIESVAVFHAGTAKNADGDLVTAGGRVLGVTAIGENLQDAIAKAYSAVDLVSWDGMQFRRDIGR